MKEKFAQDNLEGINDKLKLLKELNDLANLHYIGLASITLAAKNGASKEELLEALDKLGESVGITNETEGF